MLTSLGFRYLARAAGIIALMILASQIHIWIDTGNWRPVSTATLTSAVFPGAMNNGAAQAAWWHTVAYALPLWAFFALIWAACCIAALIAELSAIQSDPSLLSRVLADD